MAACDNDNAGGKTEIELSEGTLELNVGDCYTIRVENYEDVKEIEVSMDNPIVTISERDNGVYDIKAEQEGETEITFSAPKAFPGYLQVKVKNNYVAEATPAPSATPEPVVSSTPAPTPIPTPTPTPEPEVQADMTTAADFETQYDAALGGLIITGYRGDKKGSLFRLNWGMIRCCR